MTEPETPPTFSSATSAIYIFNLIVGTGALALPAAFSEAGYVLGTSLLLLLALFSFMTATWVVEAMSACNGIIKIEQSRLSHRIEEEVSGDQVKDEVNYFSEPEEEDSDKSYLVKTDLTGQASYGTVEGREASFTLDRRLELADMADLLFNKAGRLAFSLCMVAYLYGDLAIYCTAISKSLLTVTCRVNTSLNTSDNEPCWEAVPRLDKSDVYRIYVALFLLLLGPFVFLNVSKTKYLQMFTTVMRWTAFTAMVTLAVLRLGDPASEHGRPQMANFTSIPAVFGVSVYAFMCHHSIPGLVSPVRDKTKISGILASDFLLIAAFYLTLSFTGIFAFPAPLPDLYTLAFSPKEGGTLSLVRVVDYFLALFPVFTLSTNFPIIAITLRNNLESLVTKALSPSSLSPRVSRVVFPLLATVPPALVALATDNVEILVTITGSFAGAGIQYVIPCCLVFLARRRGGSLVQGVRNQQESVFRHTGWVVLVLAWSMVAVCLVTTNLVIKATK